MDSKLILSEKKALKIKLERLLTEGIKRYHS